jgi:thiamine-phosphate pyrophosphorylase
LITPAEARLYLVSRAELKAGPLVGLVAQLADAGVDLIQLREKEMEAGDILRTAAPIADACRAAGVPFLLNDRPDLALALGAGVHVGQNDVPVEVVRAIVPDAMLGLSTHAEPEIDAALALGDRIDYFVVGPVYETPTKLGRPAVGLGLLRYAAANADRPWFAIGGIDESNLGDVLEAGARRIVVVRAITGADDPIAAARRLRGVLVERAVG